MKLSNTVSSLVLFAILLVFVSAEAVDGVSARNNSREMRRNMRNRMREGNLNHTILNDNSTVVGRESENKSVDELKNVVVGSKRYRDVEVESNADNPFDLTRATITAEPSIIENERVISKNPTESKSDNTMIPNSDKQSANENATIPKSDIQSANENATIPKSDIQSENDNLTIDTSEFEVGNDDVSTSDLKTRFENKNEMKVSKPVTTSGGNRMSELRNKFLSGSSTRNKEPTHPTNASTIVIGPNHLHNFKRNFQNSPKFRDTLFEPVLTTVIKTKTILKDEQMVTVTEKSFLFYRDQTELPKVSKVTNITSSSNSQHFEITENKAKTMRFINDPNNPSEIVATKHGSVENLPGSCAELMKRNAYASNGVHTINVLGYGPTDVYCFADPMGSGCAWTIFMRRVNIGDSFNKNWQDYKRGFGEPNQSFFLGLDRIYAQTSDRRQELGIFTKFETNDIEVENYAHFVLGGAETAYRVEELGEFSKTSAICRLTRFSKFSTQDVDNGYQYDKCAQALGMGWWYSERCKSAIKISGVRAYINAPTIMGLRPRGCQA